MNSLLSMSCLTSHEENALAPGTGLGMSLVRSIVTMLGGSIDLRSRVGEGTIVQVSLPLQRPTRSVRSSANKPLSREMPKTPRGPRDAIQRAQDESRGCKIAVYGISGTDQILSPREPVNIKARYISQWFGIEIFKGKDPREADVVVLDERDLPRVLESDKAAGSEGFPALVVICSTALRRSQAVASSSKKGVNRVVEFISKPFGPYKLAEALGACLTRLRQHRAEGAEAEKAAPTTRLTNHGPPMSRHISLDLISIARVGSEVTSQSGTIVVDSEDNSMPRSLAKDINHNSQQCQETLPSEPTTLVNETKASVRLPLRPSIRTNLVSSRAYSSPGALKETASARPRLLLVDDNKINLKLLQTFMRKRKYSWVDSAENGELAVRAVKSAALPYDFIFMDISMPVMNGFEATRAIRDHEAETKSRKPTCIIALTGLASARD